MSELSEGDRVELIQLSCLGTVEHADAGHVRVRWDDGTVGLLYFDESMMPNARYLRRLSSLSPRP